MRAIATEEENEEKTGILKLLPASWDVVSNHRTFPGLLAKGESAGGPAGPASHNNSGQMRVVIGTLISMAANSLEHSV